MEYRMYSITLMHLNGRQQGIQAGHATDVYGYRNHSDIDFAQWVTKDLTVIVLQTYSTAQLEEAYEKLVENKIKVVKFLEPCLGNIPTAISFLVPDTVWDKKIYPDANYQIYVDPEPSKDKAFEIRRATQKSANILKYGIEIATLRDFLLDFDLANS